MEASVLLDHASGWHGWWFAPFWILLWVVVISVVIRGGFWRGRAWRRSDAREILAERFARGEIDASEYRDRLDVLSK